MEIKVPIEKIYACRRMLLQMDQGDFSQRIEIEGTGNHFEMIEQLVNKLCEDYSQCLMELVKLNPKGSWYFFQNFGFLLDNDFKVTSVESKTINQLNYHLQDIVGRPFKELLDPHTMKGWEITEVKIDLAVKNDQFIKLCFPGQDGLQVCHYCHINKYLNGDEVGYVVCSMVPSLHELAHFKSLENEKNIAYKNSKSIGMSNVFSMRIEDRKRIEEVTNFIHCMVYGPMISSSELARKFGTNVTKLRADFKAVIGDTPNQYHANIRIFIAMKAIELDPEKPLTEIATDLGYKNYGTFANKFKKAFGYSPKVAQKRALRLEITRWLDQNSTLKNYLEITGNDQDSKEPDDKD